VSNTETLPDWRTAKKAATRMRIREAALRLFRDHGYDEVTIEQIAGEAGVTHTTFFRYFPTKEDVVLSDDYDPLIIDLIRNQPAERAPVAKLCESLLVGLSQIYAAQKQELLQQMRLVLGVPALRARLWENQLGNQQVILDAFDPEEQTFELMVVISAVYAASTTAIITWASNNGTNELPELLAQAFAALHNMELYPR
jgi:AcrR family transcriptional regulator